MHCYEEGGSWYGALWCVVVVVNEGQSVNVIQAASNVVECGELAIFGQFSDGLSSVI